jgi:hypothetical protein
MTAPQTGPEPIAVEVLPPADRPAGHRAVPVLAEEALGHYPVFREFLAEVFGLDLAPLGPPGLLRSGDRTYELVFVGRSGRPFPDGVEVHALVPGLEPLDVARADRDVWAILTWLVEGVAARDPRGWSGEALAVTGRIYRVPAAPQDGPAGDT